MILKRLIGFLAIFAVAFGTHALWGLGPLTLMDTIGRLILASLACFLLHIRWKRAERRKTGLKDTFS